MPLESFGGLKAFPKKPVKRTTKESENSDTNSTLKNFNEIPKSFSRVHPREEPLFLEAINDEYEWMIENELMSSTCFFLLFFGGKFL